ncbi:MAG: hypothetical protein ACXVEF_36520 [Polyangiales bacterium]
MGPVLADDLRRAISTAVKEGEAKTSAELVVVVRARSGTYRDVHYLFGFLLGVVTLMALLYLPHEFPLALFGVDVIVSFILGTSLAAGLVPFGRVLVSKKRMDAQVDENAHAAFFERGVTKTSARTGVLVFFSLFEQQARVLADLGIDVAEMGDAWTGALAAANEAARDPDMIPAAVRALGVALAEHHPRSADDKNELADEVG